MLLKTRMGLILCCVVAAYVVLSGWAMVRVVYPGFQSIDQQQSARDAARVMQALKAEQARIESFLRDWGAWDESRAFLLGQDPDYEAGNLGVDSFLNLKLDFILFLDNQRRLFWGRWHDLDTGELRPLDATTLASIRHNAALFDVDESRRLVSGPTRIGGVPAIVGSHRVLDSQYANPAGYLVFGRLLTDAVLSELRGQTGVSFDLVSPGRPAPEPAPDVVSSRQSWPMLGNAESFIALVQTPREVSAAGADSIRIAMALLLLGGLLLTAITWLVLHRQIILPVSRLSRHIRDIRSSGSLERRLALNRSDELGDLGDQFDALTRDLSASRADLEQARDEALETSRLKSRFLATMSQEIRTPMSGIMGMTEMLQKTRLSDKQRRLARSVRASADTLLHLITDILDFSKVEAGRLTLEDVPLNLTELVEDCVTGFADAAARKKLKLVCRFEPPRMHASYRGDPVRLRQVLSNLVGNAVKFTQKGEVAVDVHVVEQTHDQAVLKFLVSDTGIGIAPGELDRIFESFYQVDSSDSRQYDGTGLGLAICRNLVEVMNGQIGVTSTPDKGSTFWFTLTLPKAAAEGWRESARRRLLAGSKLLLVDQEQSTHRRVLCEILASWGVDVATADDVAAAERCLHGAHAGYRPIEALIVDQSVPGSLDWVAELADQDRFADVPVLLLGARDGSPGVASDNVLHLLEKPVRQTALAEALERALKPSKAAEDEPVAPVVDTVGARILLVEDNPVNVELVLGMLDSMNCVADAIDDGEQAVSLVSSASDYDLVLMDCQMPGLDGLQATRRIRLLERHTGRRVPIVAITANAQSEVRQRCLDAGMDDYLSKPFTLDQLSAVLTRWLPTGTLTVAGVEGADETDETDAAAEKPVVLDAFRIDAADGQLMDRVVRQFLDSSQEYLERLSGACEAGDAEALRVIAQNFKSSASFLGAEPLAGLCRALEESAGTGDVVRASRLVLRIEHEHRKVRAWLTEQGLVAPAA